MNELKDQKQKPLPVETVQKAQARLIEARQNFAARFGEYPSVMHVGRDLFRAAFPISHAFRPDLPEAIGDTLILPQPKLPSYGIALMKRGNKAA